MTRAQVPGELVTVLSGPEQLFGVDSIEGAPDGSVLARQIVRPEVLDAQGVPQLAALGVLVDDVLGYAVNRQTSRWSVTTELSIDVAGALPSEGDLTCVARPVHVDDEGALVRGEVRDAAGRLVALGTLRGRFLDLRPADDLLRSGSSFELGHADRRHIDALLSPEVERIDSGLRVEVSERFINPAGSLHGGMHFCLVERAGRLAVPALASTASVRIQMVGRAAPGSQLEVTASIVHRGRSLAVVQVTTKDHAGRTCSSGTVVLQ